MTLELAPWDKDGRGSQGGQVRGIGYVGWVGQCDLIGWRVWVFYSGWPDWHGLTGAPKVYGSSSTTTTSFSNPDGGHNLA